MSSEFFVSFWSWNSSSLKLYRSFDSSTYSILKIYRLCHSPSFAALIMVIASFPHLFVAIFRSVPEKKILSSPLGSSSTRNINWILIDILCGKDHWSSDYLQCFCFRCTCRQANDHLCWRLKHAKAGHVWSTASDRITQTIPGTLNKIHILNCSLLKKDREVHMSFFFAVFASRAAK